MVYSYLLSWVLHINNQHSCTYYLTSCLYMCVHCGRKINILSFFLKYSKYKENLPCWTSRRTPKQTCGRRHRRYAPKHFQTILSCCAVVGALLFAKHHKHGSEIGKKTVSGFAGLWVRILYVTVNFQLFWTVNIHARRALTWSESEMIYTGSNSRPGIKYFINKLQKLH